MKPDSMQLGFVTAILPDLELPDIFDFAGHQGYQCIEVMCWPKDQAERRYAGVTHIEVELIDQNVGRITELIDKSGVQISGLGYYPNPLVPDRDESTQYVGHIKKIIHAANLLEVGIVNTFVGRDWKKSVDENWPRFLEIWKPIIDFAQDNGVKVAIENCPMFFSDDEWPGGKNLATTPKIWERMFNDIPSDNFGLNFDPSHFIWQQMDYLKAIGDYGHKFFHAHAKDVKIDRHNLNDVGIMANPLEFHTPKLPGLGEVDWSNFFDALSKVGFNGPVCVEVEDRDYEGSLEKRKKSLVVSYDYLKPFFP